MSDFMLMKMIYKNKFSEVMQVQHRKSGLQLAIKRYAKATMEDDQMIQVSSPVFFNSLPLQKDLKIDQVAPIARYSPATLHCT